MPTRREFLPRCGGKSGCAPDRRELLCKDIGHQRLHRRVGGIEYDKAVRTQEPLEPAGKCFRHAGALPVGGSEVRHHGRGEVGRGEGPFELRECLGHAAGQAQGPNRQFPGPLRTGERHGVGVESLVEHGTARHFFPVVILGIHPEERDDGHAESRLGAPRQLQAGQGLEEREQRPAECSGLLPRDHGHASRIPQPVGRFP